MTMSLVAVTTLSFVILTQTGQDLPVSTLARPEPVIAPVSPAPAPSPGLIRGTEEFISVFSDPSFQRRLAESYLAESDIEPRVSTEERKKIESAVELLGAEEVDRAITVLSSAREPKASAVIDFTLANIYFQREQLVEAAELYEVAVDKYPRFRRAWRNLAMIRVRQNDFARAMPALARVIELGGADALTYGLLGFAHSAEGNELSAESAYRLAVLLDPRTVDWQMGLARSFFRQERFPEAATLCGQLLSASPERADLWLLQANAYIGMKEPLKAAGNYEIVDGMGKSTVESLNMLADIYVNESLYDLAVNTYGRALALDDDHDTMRAVRAAKVLSARGAHDELAGLLGLLDEKYRVNLAISERKDVLRLKRRLATADGATEEEARLLVELVELDPLDGESLILLGQHAKQKGELEQAVFYFERAAGIEAFEADAKLSHAQLLVGQGRYADALPLLRRVQQIKPRDALRDFVEQVQRAAKG